jgi:hypothetical protein
VCTGEAFDKVDSEKMFECMRGGGVNKRVAGTHGGSIN